MFTKILVANDGSAGARRALEIAVDIAARYGAELHSISVEEGLPHYAATIDEVDAVKEKENHYFEQVTGRPRTSQRREAHPLRRTSCPATKWRQSSTSVARAASICWWSGSWGTLASTSASGAAPRRA